jgi:hypothetical protein
MWLWECSSSAITQVDALSQFNLVRPMHHPHYNKPYMHDMPYLKHKGSSLTNELPDFHSTTYFQGDSKT